MAVTPEASINPRTPGAPTTVRNPRQSCGGPGCRVTPHRRPGRAWSKCSVDISPLFLIPARAVIVVRPRHGAVRSMSIILRREGSIPCVKSMRFESVTWPFRSSGQSCSCPDAARVEEPTPRTPGATRRWWPPTRGTGKRSRGTSCPPGDARARTVHKPCLNLVHPRLHGPGLTVRPFLDSRSWRHAVPRRPDLATTSVTKHFVTVFLIAGRRGS